MKEDLIYPLVLDVKIKKESLMRVIFVMEKDRVKFLDKNCPKDVVFQTPIEDCDTFFRKSTDNTKQELYLISRSNSFSEIIIKHKDYSILSVVKDYLEKTIKPRKSSLSQYDNITKIVRASSIDSSIFTDDLDSNDSNIKEGQDYSLDNSNLSKRVLQIISLPYENFKFDNVKIKSSNIHYLKEKLYNSERQHLLKNVSDLSSTKDYLIEKSNEFRNYILITISFLFMVLFFENVLIVLLIAPFLLYTEKNKFTYSISNLLPSTFKDFFAMNNNNINPKVSFNINYYLKSSITVKMNLITVFNYVNQLENDIFWRKSMVEINESSSKFSYILKSGDNNTFNSNEFVRNSRLVNRSVIITDYNEKELLNIIILEPTKRSNHTKISMFTLLNNSFNIVSVKSALKDFVSFLEIKLSESSFQSNSPCVLIEKEFISNKRVSEIY